MAEEKKLLIAGVDEAGKGCLLGSLVFGCTLFYDDGTLERLRVNDSKKLSPKRREELYEKIIDSALDTQILEFTASHLNDYHYKKGLTMNEIEVLGFSMVLKIREPRFRS